MGISESLIESFFKRISFAPSRIYCGFSGGADSTALLVLLEEHCRKQNISLRAVHFEHGLRGKEGKLDAEWCREFCESRNIEFQIFSLDTPRYAKKGESIEEAARRLRLEKWKSIVAMNGECAALAHNADDRVENLFLRLMRGSNCSGLSSPRDFQKIDAVPFIRPLLSVRRRQIEEFLRSKGIDNWRTDSSNLESEFRRNFFRNTVFPVLRDKIPDFEKAVLKSIDSIADDADFIEQTAEKHFAKVAAKDTIQMKAILSTHRAILMRLLRKWISTRIGREFIPDGKILERIRDESAKFANEKQNRSKPILVPLNGERFLRINQNGIKMDEIKSRPKMQKKAIRWKWKSEKQILWNGITITSQTTRKRPDIKKIGNRRDIAVFDADILPHELVLRTPYKGDKMITFGSDEKNTRLKKIFESAKIPSAEKWHSPLLCLPEGTVIWAPLVRRSNFATINAKTANFAVFQATKEK